MEATVSSTFQVQIPRPVWESANLRPGQKLQVFAKGGVVYLVPVPSLAEIRGIAKGCEVAEFRDKTG